MMTSRRLYELVLANGVSASPFVWRIRYALAHKGLPFESVQIGFTDIPKVFGGRYKTVPVLADGDEMVVDSWDIVDYLERTYPDRPALFSGPAEYAMVRLFDVCFFTDVIRKFFNLYALDIHDAARPEDRRVSGVALGVRPSRSNERRGRCRAGCRGSRAATRTPTGPPS